MIDIPPPFDAAWFRASLGFIVGSAFGSFATMLAYSLPRRLSIVFPGSHCPSCRQSLVLRDLVPIFSFVFSKGRCRYCHVKIGSQYLAIELATSLACAVASVVLGYTPLLLIAYAAIVTVITFISWKSK